MNEPMTLAELRELEEYLNVWRAGVMWEETLRAIRELIALREGLASDGGVLMDTSYLEQVARHDRLRKAAEAALGPLDDNGCQLTAKALRAALEEK